MLKGLCNAHKYRLALVNYVNSGIDISYQRYEFSEDWGEKKFELVVFFPFITYYQFRVFELYYLILSQKEAEEYALSHEEIVEKRIDVSKVDNFYRTWDFFSGLFQIDFSKDVNDNYMYGNPSYMVYLLFDGRTHPIEIFNSEELREEVCVNLQKKYLIKMTEGLFSSPYYRLFYINNNVGFLYGEPVCYDVASHSFEMDTYFSHDTLFENYVEYYLSHQSEDTITDTLNSIFHNSDTEDANVWCLHISNILQGVLSQKNPNPRMKDGLRVISDYLRQNANRTHFDDWAEQSPKQNIVIERSPAYFDLGCSLEQLNAEFDVLVAGGYLSPSTNREAFLYYFGGSKEAEENGSPLPIPTEKLVWTGKSSKILALFLESLGVDGTWKTASQVFKGINTESMKSQCSTYKKKKREKRTDDLEMIRNTERELEKITF